MKPQEEKAIELVERFMNIKPNKLSDYSRIYHPFAKQCALICCNEIMLANPHSNPFNTDIYSTFNYWNEVKNEIEKL